MAEGEEVGEEGDVVDAGLYSERGTSRGQARVRVGLLVKSVRE